VRLGSVSEDPRSEPLPVLTAALSATHKCGSLAAEAPIGSVVVPKTSVGITRNYDAFHPDAAADEEPYHITRPVSVTEVERLVCRLTALLPARLRRRRARRAARCSAELAPSSHRSAVRRRTAERGRTGCQREHRQVSTARLRALRSGLKSATASTRRRAGVAPSSTTATATSSTKSSARACRPLRWRWARPGAASGHRRLAHRRRLAQTFVINHLARANNVASADTSRRIRVGAAQMVCVSCGVVRVQHD